MALKVIQSLSSSVASGITTSAAIELSTGYLRVTPTTLCCVKVGGNPVATGDDFYLPANTSEILKERVARAKISGITTGTSTVVSFGQNNGNPFIVGDYITIGGSVGINTAHNLVTATAENPLTGEATITISYNSSSVGVVTITNAYAARSVKVSSYGAGSGLLYISEVQIASQA